MSEFEEYSAELLLASKKFMSESKVAGIAKPEQQRFLRAALTQAFFFLEAQLNYLAAHFSGSKDFDIVERSLLSERAIGMQKGVFVLTEAPKFFKLEDRIEFLLARFSKSVVSAKGQWFSNLKTSLLLRNRLVHPKEVHEVLLSEVELAILAILDCLSALYLAIFQKPFPLSKLGLHPGPSQEI